MEDHDEEQAAKDCKKEMSAYKKKRGIGAETKIFKVLGKYHTLRDEMNRRGWVEHDWEEVEDATVEQLFTSQAFDFLYARRARDVYRISLAPH